MLINNPSEIREWITERITYLLVKLGEADDPEIIGQ